jgi:putative nucleotidyltransferase with HDIG domain
MPRASSGSDVEDGRRRLSLDAFPEAARAALARLSTQLRATPAWLVGGALRDALLGQPVSEVDLVVTRGALALGRALADDWPGGRFVTLDEARGTCRVLSDVQIDIAELRAPALADDLRGRDFTVNALAVVLQDLAGPDGAPIIDATGGLDDLERRVVRPCGPKAIADDPVRALRAARLAIRPGWSLHPSGVSAIREAAPRVAGVSAERVRDELAAILAEPAGGAGLRLLDQLHVLPVLLPESLPMRETLQPAPHRFDVWEHSLRSVEAADLLLARLGDLGSSGSALAAHMAEQVGDALTRRETLKLAALLHDVAKPETRRVEGDRVRFLGHDVRGAERAADIAQRWRLSGRATLVLRRLIAQHLRPMHLANAGGVTRRARYRFFRDLESEALDLVLLALADAAAVRGDSPIALWSGPGAAVLRDLVEGAGEEAQASGQAPLVRGEDVMAELDLAPGPEVGRLLARVREAQALGLISTRAEAIEHLRRVATGPGDAPEQGPRGT